MSKQGIDTASETTSAAEFVDFFAEGWRLGAGERFFEHFGSRLHPDVVLLQPLVPPTKGHAQFRARFEALFEAMPDLRGKVVRWGETEDGTLIELRLRGTLGGRVVEWTVVDRIILEDGLIRERRSYFDPLPLLRMLLSRPRAALRLLPLLRKRKERR